MKRGISLKQRLLTPNVNNRLSKKVTALGLMFVVTVVLYIMANQADSLASAETDSITLIIGVTLSCLSLASVLAIAFRTSEALVVIFLVYLVGSINTLRMLSYGSVDTVQLFDTAFVIISLIWAYIKYRKDQRVKQQEIEEFRKESDKAAEVKD